VHQDMGVFDTFIYDLHENDTIWERMSLDRFATFKFRKVSGWERQGKLLKSGLSWVI
jgi:hypothetical protein